MDYQYLKCISPLDGIYKSSIKDLESFFSELSFNKYKILIEIEYLISLGKIDIYDDLGDELIEFLRNIYKNFDLDECIKLKEIEIECVDNEKQNVGAIEYYIKRIISNKDSSLDLINYIHFGLNSQDIDSNANILMIKQSISKVLLPKINKILGKIKENILEWSKVPLLSKINGLSDAPTFLGKEMLVFYERTVIQARKLNGINYTTKFGGTNGNFNAHHMALPNIDWVEFGNKFVKILGLERNQYTTQIDHYDNYAEIFDCLKRINVILIDFCQDIWSYISRGVLVHKLNGHKLNGHKLYAHKLYINFETAEGNLLLANSMLEFFSRKLPTSRLQRDSTDSTILRNVGSAFSYSLIAFNSIMEGLDKIVINEKEINNELNKNYMVIEEGLHTRMKVLGIGDQLKQISQNSNSEEIKKDLLRFIEQNDFSMEEKKYLKTITPFNYTGIYKL